MAASDDFKEQLKAGKIVDAFTLALSEAIELKITTWVSTESAADAKSPDSESNQPLPSHRLRTRINLVDGDIDNEVGAQFLGHGPYSELRQLHLDQVQQGRQIIQHNLVTLQQLFVVMASTLSKLPAASQQPSNETLSLPPSNGNH